MAYTYRIILKDLRDEGYLEKQIERMLLVARRRVTEGTLLVSLNGRIPQQKADVAGYVTDISIWKHKVVTFEVEVLPTEIEGIITDAYEIVSGYDKGYLFEPRLILNGNLLTLYKYKVGWKRRSYVLKN